MNLVELVEDTHAMFKDTSYTVGFALSWLGCEYINQHFFNSSVTPNLPQNTNVFSPEFALFATQWVCTWGVVIKGITTAYDILKIPAKLVTGKYFKKKD